MAETSLNTKKFRASLLLWYRRNRRDLPWRGSDDWYKVYLSEIILQQTTVNQGLPYFLRFLEKYPDVWHLAAASQEEILKLWAGLGYYARARNMHKTAQIIVRDHNGRFPEDHKTALKLPGIGPYSAAAILSIACNKPLAVVDGNVTRVICRIFEISKDIRLGQTKKEVDARSKTLLDPKRPGDFNQAMMELGALVCTPQKPDCPNCPLSVFCQTYQKGRTDQIPYKSPPPPKKRRFYLAVVSAEKSLFRIAKRPQKGLLAGMWEFPVYEITETQFNKKRELLRKLQDDLELEMKNAEFSAEMRHIYSHIDLRYKALFIKEKLPAALMQSYDKERFATLEELEKAGLHNAHMKLLPWLKTVADGKI